MTIEKEYPSGKLLIGDVLERIKDITDESVDVVITSPPYWGLRDYGTGKWIGGHVDCDHSQVRRKTRAERKSNAWMEEKLVEGTFGDESQWTSHTCPCGAVFEDPQWGSEPDFHDYLKKMSELMKEVKRVLKKTGSAWINLGDSYGSHRSNQESIKIGFEKQEQAPLKGLEKSRIGIPERFYINCIDAGWTARNHIVWSKANAMPTSVKDRFQNKWESIFFFVKQRKYFFNLDAVREKPLSDYKDFNRRVRDAKKYKDMGLGDFSPTLAKASEKEIEEYGNHQPEGRSHFGTGNDIKKHMEEAYLKNEASKYAGDKGSHNSNRLGQYRNKQRKEADVPGQSTQGIHRNRTEGLPDWDYTKKYDTPEDAPQGYKSIQERMAASRAVGANHDGCLNDPKGKNPGDVFNINPRPFVEAHFATFPPELPEKIIKCACPEKVCKKCGVPVQNIMEPTAEYAKLLGKSWHNHKDDLGKGMTQDRSQKADATASYQKVGETDCGCNTGFEPGVVFDPFMGSGTVADVAISLNRRWLGIELNPEYAEIIDKRLKPKMSSTLDSFE
jgi:DNA modification methylase